MPGLVDAQPILPDMTAAAMVIGPDGTCEAYAGNLLELLGLSDDWGPVGRTMDAIVAQLAQRGDLGPRFPDGEAFLPGFWLTADFENAYLETPAGRIIFPAVRRRAAGGWVVTLTEMTAAKQEIRALWRAKSDIAAAEVRARELAEEARTATEAKSAFLAEMSHEIRTPMTGVLGVTELLAEQKLTLDQRSLIETMQRSAEALLAIVNGVLDLSKIESGKLELDQTPFDPISVAEEVVSLLAPSLRGRPVELVLGADPAMSVPVVGDALRFRQVLFNLVGNAVKFTDAGSVVLGIRGRVTDGIARLEITVSDTGCGIDPVDLDRIFGAFDQGRSASSATRSGSGLGLAIARKLVGLMDGEITARSKPGSGSVFTVRVGLEVADEQTDDDQMRLEGRRVLCILPGVMAEAAPWLSREGASVVTVDDIPAALAVADDMSVPDIVLLDVGRDPAVLGARIDAVQAAFPATQLILSVPVDFDESLAPAAAGIPRLRRPHLPRRLADQLLTAGERGQQSLTVGGAALVADRPVRVLFADDNRINRVVVAKLLAREPVDLRLACDGQEAIDALRDFPADVVFLDLSMPGLDGFAATRSIRALEARQGSDRAPIVAITASASRADRDRCLAAGMDGLLAKPVRQHDLVRAIVDHVPAVALSGNSDAAAAPDASSRSVA